MRIAALVAIVLTALVLAADAAAGCYATAELAAPPATIGPGDAWTAAVTVKQHGTRPIPDAKPTVTIVGENGARTTFAAKPTDQVGVYAASVVFPAAGLWNYEVNDGFVSTEGGAIWDCSSTHTFAAVTIGGAGASGPVDGGPSLVAASGDSSAWPVLIVALVAVAVALVAAAGIGLARRSSRRHAEA